MPFADWDEEVYDMLSALKSPASARPAGVERPKQPRPSNIVGTFAWHPTLAKAFFQFNTHIFHSTLSARDRELVTVRVAWLRGAEYEWAQHARMARNAGMTDEEVEAISSGPDAPVWGERDAALLRSVDDIVADHRVGDETWERLGKLLDRKQLMDLVFTIGLYDLLAMAMNTFGVELDPGVAGFPPPGHSGPAGRLFRLSYCIGD